jgi:hypothetical protein
MSNDIQDRNRLHVQDESPEYGTEEFETAGEMAAEDYAAVRVHVTNPVAVTTGATQFGIYETIVIPVSTAAVVAYAQVLPRDDLRQYGYITAVDYPLILTSTLEQAQSPGNVVTGSVTIANPTPAQPAVPATGVAQQNVNLYPVTVVISPNGATITNVSVNGVTVGTAAGTYTVPSAGSISIAYSVATPTWVWSDAAAAATTAIAAPFPNGAYLPAGMTCPPIRHNDPVWAVNTSLVAACRASVITERGFTR